jgi:SAM-dependent methyltransferase
VLGSAEYSHTKHFAWIYFNELKVIRNICDQGPIDVLELGSSFGNSIFSKKALMNLPDVHYFGVDINAGLVESSLKYALDNKMDNVSFYHADAKDLDFILEHSSRARFDVVTSSHLLEHLDGKKYEIIEDWLSLASHALVFSIPFDGGSSGLISDHKSNFTPDDLKQISLYFQKRKDLVVDESCIDSGILTFYKSWGREQLD